MSRQSPPPRCLPSNCQCSGQQANRRELGVSAVRDGTRERYLPLGTYLYLYMVCTLLPRRAAVTGRQSRQLEELRWKRAVTTAGPGIEGWLVRRVPYTYSNTRSLLRFPSSTSWSESRRLLLLSRLLTDEADFFPFPSQELPPVCSSSTNASPSRKTSSLWSLDQDIS